MTAGTVFSLPEPHSIFPQRAAADKYSNLKAEQAYKTSISF